MGLALGHRNVTKADLSKKKWISCIKSPPLWSRAKHNDELTQRRLIMYIRHCNRSTQRPIMPCTHSPKTHLLRQCWLYINWKPISSICITFLTDMTHVVEILRHVKREITYTTCLWNCCGQCKVSKLLEYWNMCYWRTTYREIWAYCEV